MSTQKRVNWDTPATKTRRQEPRYRSQPIECTTRVGVGCFPLPAAFARYACAAASGRTAPLISILWSALAWMATKFLLPDHHIRQLIRPAFEADRRGSPPPRAHCRVEVSPRSSIPHIPYPAGHPGLHRTLPQGAAGLRGPLAPQAPDGYHRRAERYDGKRDMYFQHAA